MAAKRFPSLDGLRGVCAISVLLFHCDDLFHKGPIFQHGYLAVDIFFILSGFVIALTYEEKLKSGWTLNAFIRTRARRLLPTYFLGTLICIACFVILLSGGYAVIPGYSVSLMILSAVTTLFLIPEFFTPDNMPYPASTVAWSLLIEWIVNLLYAAGGVRLKTWALLSIAAIGWGLMTLAGYYSKTGWCVGMYQSDIYWAGLLRGIPAFCAGILLYRWHDLPFFRLLPVVSTELLLTLWLVVAVIPTYTTTPTIDALVVVLVCPALIALLIRSDAKAPGFCKPLGELSYPLYASHLGIVRLAQETPLFGLSKHPDPVRALGVVAVCLAVAWGLAKLVGAIRPSRPIPGVALRIATAPE